MYYVNFWFGAAVEVRLCFYSVIRRFDLHRIPRIVCKLLDVDIYRTTILLDLFTPAERLLGEGVGGWDGYLSLRKTCIQFLIRRS